ncbi:IQ and AAA domain-containing protein 1-like [Trichoplusia ni]|uniref:IQ and AAA domain-containing protein 1-like n=1 Tax=Trichoplusia ni TaxID=7111 RepID=A0A7E5W9N3_TRINI|nr:IQ and AAA domain-containing protein 1-like [Trichoplusia ni]
MSRDFYFNKWRETLLSLDKLTDLDLEFQVLKTHDRSLKDARHRLTMIADQYILLYNSASECLYQNLQVQKTVYMDSIIKAIVSRILELKRELEKLEGSNIVFLGHGTPEVHHTIFDVEMKRIPMESKRPEQIQIVMEETIARAREKKAELERLANLPEEPEQVELSGWETEKEIQKREEEERKKKEIEAIPIETRLKIKNICMIAAQEKTRQVTRLIKVGKLRHEMWFKELTGTLKPPPSLQLRDYSAELIQKVFRVYFKLKRERIKDCKRNELLGINVCDTPNTDIQRRAAEEMLYNRSKILTTYEKEWIARRERLKVEYLSRKKDQLIDETRDQIREWFLKWFTEVQFFYDIPKDGADAIFKGYVLSPHEWVEENKTQLLRIEADKKKSPQDLKFQKMEAKRQQQALKKEEQMRIKAEALLMKKMMKNPTMHPGYYYSKSKKISLLLEALDTYHKSWDYYDEKETLDVKEKYVHRIDVEDAIKDAKIEVLPEVDEYMRKELDILKKALKEDYIANEEEMPVNVTKPIKGEKKPKPIKQVLTKKVVEIIEKLVLQDFIIECPKVKFEDFIGDPNFGGEDLRSQIRPALPFNFEIKSFWWERCREVTFGYRRILLVGPKYSGRSVLVRALASLNDAVLFELNPRKVQGEMATASFLKHLIDDVVACAKALQPSVIHIKHVEKLFYTKTPPEEAEMNLGLLKTYFIIKLMKKIKKTDKITIIGTCTDPWLAKSSALLKQFPIVLLLPNSNYSLVVQIVKDWIIRHKVLPSDFNVSNLAYVVQGYSYGYLNQALEDFMSAERIAKIAAFGVSPMDVYNFILENTNETKAEYEKFLNWYTEKTPWGIKEAQHMQDQKDFMAAVEKYSKKKKPKSGASSATPSHTGL